MPAGGFKTFVAGEILTAADTNSFLMQGVLVFADATARDAAITSPVEGQFAFLKDTDELTFYDGSAFVEVQTGLGTVVATGGTVTTVVEGEVEFTVHTFTGSGTFAVTTGGTIDVFCVAGGGGGGQYGGGGGGGVQTLRTVVAPGSFAVTVGAGGVKGTTNATNGVNSSFAGLLVSTGGGKGGGNQQNGSAGGSGGGGGADNGGNKPGGAGINGLGFRTGEGRNGGLGRSNATGSNRHGGGGGGALELGGNGDTSLGGAGGGGATTVFRATSESFAGGGSGGDSATDYRTGGLGGGGGSNNTGAGVVNTGGGGAAGKNGGSGIVIVRYVA